MMLLINIVFVNFTDIDFCRTTAVLCLDLELHRPEERPLPEKTTRAAVDTDGVTRVTNSVVSEPYRLLLVVKCDCVYRLSVVTAINP